MPDNDLNIYDLTRDWWNFCFENPEKIKPNHIALYLFAVEHCNRLAWKRKFGLPTTMAMEAIGIKSYNTYIAALRDLIDWGFIEMIEKSKNQHSSNIVALSKNDKAHNKALDKAMYKHATKHRSKQGESTQQSTDSIDIPDTYLPNNQIPGDSARGGMVASIVKSVPIPEPIRSNEVLNAMIDFWEYVTEVHKRKPNIHQIEAQYGTLIELQSKGDDPVKVIRQSIEHGSKSLYALREREFNQKKNKPNETDEIFDYMRTLK